MHRQKYLPHAHIFMLQFLIPPLSSYTCSAQTKALSFTDTLAHTQPYRPAAASGEVVFWIIDEVGPCSWKAKGGVCFQKPKLLLTWGQSFCPSESHSILLI